MLSQPKRKFNFDRKQWLILLCLAGLLAFALAYLFIYIPSNEKYLNERRFNSMRRIENNIGAKQTNTFKLIESLASNFGNKNIDQDSLEAYLKNGFSDSQPLVLNRFYVSPQKVTDSIIKKLPGNGIETDAINANGNITFSIKKFAEGKLFNLSMNYTVERFFAPLLQGAGFDEFIVVMQNEIIYETFPSGLNGSIFDSLIQINKYLVGANSRKITIGGSDYQCFIQPFSLGKVKKDCFIMGMLKYEKFQAERIQLPANFVIHLITAGIILLILLPWVKLFNLGLKDRLSLVDGALSFVVAMLLVSLLFMGFANLAIRYQGMGEKAGLEEISRQIEQRNTAYFAAMKKRLESLDSLANKHSELCQNLSLIKKPGFIRPGTHYSVKKDHSVLQDSLKQKVNALVKEDSIYQVFWLDTQTGIEKFNWSIDENNAPAPNLSGRKYFKEQQSGSRNYSVEQVISWTTGLFRTILATRSKINPSQIVCLSFSVAPVNKPVLPAGYRFAIVDANGEVFYHSTEIHNLNENFPEETSEPSKVRAAIGSHTAHYLTTRYKGAETNIFIKPASFDGFNYRVIVTYDKSFETARETGAFGFTLVMLLVFFLLVAIQLLIVVWVSAKKTRLNVLKMETDWIWPRPSLYNVYRYAALYHLFLLLLLLAVYYMAGFLSFLYMLLFAVCLATLFINFQYIRHYRNEKRVTVIRYKKRNIAALMALVIVINFFATWHLAEDLKQVLLFLLFEFSAILLAIITYRLFCRYGISKAEPDETQVPAAHTKFISSYAQMAITRLIISSGLPVLFFYQYAYNNQIALQAHYLQLKSASEILKNDSLLKHQALSKVNFYTDKYWIHEIIPQPAGKKQLKAKNNEVIAAELLNSFRFYKTSTSNNLDATAHNNTDDSAYSYEPLLGTIERKGVFTTYATLAGGQVIALKSQPIGFRYPIVRSIPTALYWILFLASLLALYILIKRVIRQIFALDVPGDVMPVSVAHNMINLPTGNKLTYITGLPGAGKMKFVLSSTLPEKRLVVDLFELPSTNLNWKESATVIFNHFEYILFSKEACKQFISLLEMMLISKEKPALIILSNMDPNRAIQLISAFSEGNEPKLHERYQAVLGHFNNIVLPIKVTDMGAIDDWEKAHHQKWMKDEFGVSSFTERLRLPLKAAYFKEKNHRAKKISNNPVIGTLQKGFQTLSAWFDDSGSGATQNATWSLQNISGIFYYYIWQSLSPEERYLVYDLAEEGLVNQSNKFHLSMLIQKGLVKRKEPNGQLELMNESFKDFVLITVNKDEALQLKNELKASGSWSELKTPFMLIILGILAILIASQQEVFSTVIGYLTAIAALIPTINALFSFVKPASSTSK